MKIPISTEEIIVRVALPCSGHVLDSALLLLRTLAGGAYAEQWKLPAISFPQALDLPSPQVMLYRASIQYDLKNKQWYVPGGLAPLEPFGAVDFDMCFPQFATG